MTTPTHILSRLGVPAHDALRVVEELTHYYGPGGWTTSDFTDRFEEQRYVVDSDIRSSELHAIQRWARAEIGADTGNSCDDEGGDDE